MAVNLGGVRPTQSVVTEGGGKITIASVYMEQGTRGIMPDENGFYKIWGGAFNCNNFKGDFYPFVDELRKQYTDKDSDFNRRMASGLVGGECNHPDITIYKGHRPSILSRLDRLDKTRECWMVGKVELDYESFVNDNGTKVVGTWIWIKPTGAFADAAKRALEDPKVNVCVSLRTLSINTMRPDLTWVRKITRPLHYDWVEEQGIGNATKHITQGYSCESLTGNDDNVINLSQYTRNETEIRFCDVHDLQEQMEVEGLSMESCGINLDDLKSLFSVTPNETNPAFNF